jgi:hypothetical protein
VSRRPAWLACVALLAAAPGGARAQTPTATFEHDVTVLRAAGPRVPSPADSALRLRVVRGALALGAPPRPPAVARACLEHARRAVRHCSCRDSTLYAVAELTRAIHEAPWWGEPHLPLGVALQHLVRNAEAGVCLELYLAAEPCAPDRERVGRQALRLRGRRATTR